MVRKYVYGEPFETEAVVEKIKAEQGTEDTGFGRISLKNGFTFSCQMALDDIVYGLGEANRGIREATAISVTALTILTIRRTSGRCTGRIIL